MQFSCRKVSHMTQRVKIHGGPGCGKTYTLTQFYQKYIIEGYTPDDITVLTFRRNAADDLIDATLPHAKVDVKELKKHVGTIHSICWRLLGYPAQIGKDDLEEFVRMNGYENFIKSRFEKTKGDSEESVYSGDIFDMYAWLRNTCTPFDKWKLYPGSCNIKLPAARVLEFFKQYDAYKTERGKIDFSDMLQRVIDQGIKLD